MPRKVNYGPDYDDGYDDYDDGYDDYDYDYDADDGGNGEWDGSAFSFPYIQTLIISIIVYSFIIFL